MPWIWMRALLVALALCLLPGVAGAVPTTLTHEGLLLDDEGLPMDGEHEFVFSLYDAAEDGETLWSEQHTMVLVAGYYRVLLGERNGLDGVFDGSSLFLGISVDAGPDLQPLHPMASVPYAVVAGTAEGLTVAGRTLVDRDGDIAGLVDLRRLVVDFVAVGCLPLVKCLDRVRRLVDDVGDEGASEFLDTVRDGRAVARLVFPVELDPDHPGVGPGVVPCRLMRSGEQVPHRVPVDELV